VNPIHELILPMRPTVSHRLRPRCRARVSRHGQPWGHSPAFVSPAPCLHRSSAPVV